MGRTQVKRRKTKLEPKKKQKKTSKLKKCLHYKISKYVLKIKS